MEMEGMDSSGGKALELHFPLAGENIFLVQGDDTAPFHRMNLHLGSRSDGGEQAKLKQAPRACRALFVKNMDSETSTATSTCGDSSARKTFMVS